MCASHFMIEYLILTEYNNIAIIRHAIFYCLLPDNELLDSFSVSRTELPVLYLLEEGEDSLTPFPGEVCVICL